MTISGSEEKYIVIPVCSCVNIIAISQKIIVARANNGANNGINL